MFQIEPVLPSETDKKGVGGQIMDIVRPAGRACSQLPVGFLIFQIGPLLREIWPFLWTNVRIMFFHLLKLFIFCLYLFVWAGRFLRGRTILEGSPSCGQVIILASLEHWFYSSPQCKCNALNFLLHQDMLSGLTFLYVPHQLTILQHFSTPERAIFEKIQNQSISL